MQIKCFHEGFALPVCLAIMLLISLTVLSAQQTALLELRLSSTLTEVPHVYSLAEYGIDASLSTLNETPSLLPPPTETTKFEFSPHGQSVNAEIIALTSGIECPGFPTGERQHFEILATASTSDAVIRTHKQGFYVCREVCLVAGCAPDISPAVRTYWTTSL
ncbi:MAG: hypothetical protein ACR2QG_11030 [Gammaproteobacteria bacterium]